MLNSLGQNHVWLTLTPNSRNTYFLSVLTGFINIEEIEKSNHLLATAQERHFTAFNHPYFAAEYFNHVIKIFIDVILSWNSEYNCSKKSPGLFGFTKAFFISPETQGNGNLHGHILLWIHGMPTSTLEYIRLVDTTDFAFKLLEYTKSIVIPGLPEIDNSTCPICSNQLKTIELETKYLGKNFEKQPPICCECLYCDIKFSTDGLILSKISKLADELNIDLNLMNEQIEHFNCKLEPLPWPTPKTPSSKISNSSLEPL